MSLSHSSTSPINASPINVPLKGIISQFLEVAEALNVQKLTL